MAAPLSVVIPTLNAADGLPGALQSLFPGLQDGLIRDLVISDGGSSDASQRIAEDAGAIWIATAQGRGAQLAEGVAASKGDWILFLHADSELDEDWITAARTLMRTQGRVGYFRLRFRASGVMPTLVAGWANMRSRIFGLPYGDQGLLIHRQTLVDVGGVPDVPLMEDVILARALKGKLIALDSDVSTSADRYKRDGWLRRGAKNLVTLVRFFLGADPKRLAQSYTSSRN